MITTSTAWDSLVLNSQTQVFPLIRLYYGDESAYVAVSTADITYESVFYRGLLKNKLSMREKIDTFSHRHSISNAAVSQTYLRHYDFTYGQGALFYEMFGYMTVLIADYANTNKNTSMQLIGGGLGGSDSKVQIQNNTWDSTVAVTNIKVMTMNVASQFMSGTEMTLYGIKDS